MVVVISYMLASLLIIVLNVFIFYLRFLKSSQLKKKKVPMPQKITPNKFSVLKMPQKITPHKILILKMPQKIHQINF